MSQWRWQTLMRSAYYPNTPGPCSVKSGAASEALLWSLTLGLHAWRINVKDVCCFRLLNVASAQARHCLHVFSCVGQLATGRKEEWVLKQRESHLVSQWSVKLKCFRKSSSGGCASSGRMSSMSNISGNVAWSHMSNPLQAFRTISVRLS